MDKKYVQSADLPHHVWERIRDIAARSSIGLVEVAAERNHAEIIGSGTLVSVAGRKCVLTASHVYRKKVLRIPPGGSIGFATHNREQGVFADPQHCDLVSECAGEEYDVEGPDVCLLALPDVDAAKLESWMTFEPLADVRDRLGPFEEWGEKGLWVIAGAPAEGQRAGSSAHFGFVLEGRAIVGGVEPVAARGTDESEVIELRASKSVVGVPEDYGGVSGGPLWLAQIPEDYEDPNFVPILTLAGVCFFQDRSPKEHTNVYAQGPKTLYGPLLRQASGG